MSASLAKTDQEIATGTTSPTRNGSASPQRPSAPVLRDLHGWYRWGRRDQWLHALTDRGQHAGRPHFADRPLLGWPRRKEWLRATWKTRFWWFRQDYLGTPLRHCAEGREMTRKYGALVARQHGISVARQVAEQVWLRLRYGVPPEMYYSFRLFLPRFRRQAGVFIYWKKMGPLHLQLISRTCPEEAEVLKDKVRFATWCTAHGIPTAPVLASFRDGTMTPQAWEGHGTPLPCKDLFSKNAALRHGMEATRWRYVGDGCYKEERGVFDQTGLIEFLEEQSLEMPLLLQECFVNHERIAGLSSGGLCTVRLVTGRLPGGEPTPLFASFRMPTGGAVVDNLSADGIAAPVALETGRLGSALFLYPHAGPPRHTHHPDTEHPIENFHVPRWDELVALGVRAHRAFPEMPFVGWDIALAEQGPLVVEGNEDWGPATIQVPHERPLTDTVYQKYYDIWMRHCLEAESAQHVR